MRDDIALRRIGPDAEGCLRARVVADGDETPFVVKGEELEAAVEIEDKLILFVVYGDPYEDSLEIYLVDRSWRILDQATLAMMGATGRFGNLRLDPPASITFSFWAGRDWRVSVFDPPRLRLPLPYPGLGLWRPVQWRRWFELAR